MSFSQQDQLGRGEPSGGAASGLGVPELLDFIAEFAPSPVGRVVQDADGNDIACAADGPLRALCFKVMFERQAGRIAFLRIFSGNLKSGDTAVLARTEETVKIGHPARFQGSQKAEVAQAGIGDIVALPKVGSRCRSFSTFHINASTSDMRRSPRMIRSGRAAWSSSVRGPSAMVAA